MYFLCCGWNVGLAQREAQIAARETSKNLGLIALTSTDFSVLKAFSPFPVTNFTNLLVLLSKICVYQKKAVPLQRKSRKGLWLS